MTSASKKAVHEPESKNCSKSKPSRTIRVPNAVWDDFIKKSNELGLSQPVLFEKMVSDVKNKPNGNGKQWAIVSDGKVLDNGISKTNREAINTITKRINTMVVDEGPIVIFIS